MQTVSNAARDIFGHLAKYQKDSIAQMAQRAAAKHKRLLHIFFQAGMWERMKREG